MWFRAPVEEADPVPVSASLFTAIAMCTAVVVVVGVYPSVFAHLGDLAAKATGG